MYFSHYALEMSQFSSLNNNSGVSRAIFTERDYITFASLLLQIHLLSVCNIRAPYSEG